MTRPDQLDDGVTSTEVGPSSHSVSARSAPRRRWLWLVLSGLAVLLLVRGLVVETFAVPTGSMEPTLRGGDRIVVLKLGAHEVRRGQIVVFDGTEVFAGQVPAAPGTVAGIVQQAAGLFGLRPGEVDYVKRVMGVGGDEVAMDADGRIRVNGRPLDEPYAQLAPASPFRVRVPTGRLWVMGDHRAASEDSRSHLGDPGGGMVPTAAVIGRVVGRYWPLGDVGSVGAAGLGGQERAR